MELFDLTQSPGLIRPSYFADAIVVFAGLVVTVIFLAVKARPQEAREGPHFGLVTARGLGWITVLPRWTAGLFLPLSLLIVLGDVRHALTVRDAVVHRRYQTLQGCLDYFAPGESVCRRGGGGAERWAVGGRDFSFCGDAVGFGYHGGGGASIVHPDSWVRVSYVTAGLTKRDDVVRLETRPGLCPAAPPPPAGG